jgi:hypothetical protein
VLKPGFFRINLHALSNSGTPATEQFWNKVVKNGVLIHAGAELSAGGTGWFDNTIDLICQFSAGDTIELYILTPEDYSFAYHQFDNMGHSRLQIQFMGEL